MTTLTTATTLHTPAVGTAHTRVEGRDKVTGAARYAGEVPFAGLAHGWLVLSTVARGRIRDLDTESVLAMPGVLAVLEHRNAPRLTTDYTSLLGMRPDPTCAVFQHDRVPHLGWPVALVVAETSEQAREAAETLVVHYEQEPHDVGFGAGHPDAYAADGHIPAVTEKGDLDAELAAAAVVVDAEYTTPEEHHHPMEPHAATARWDGGQAGGDRLQPGRHLGRGRAGEPLLARPGRGTRTLRTRRRRLRQQGVRAHQVAAVMAATVLQRPVRVVLTRRQMFSLAGYRSPTVQHVRLGADSDGHLRALAHRSLSQTASGYEFVESSAGVARVMYDADAHHTANRVVRLDVPSPTFMRAPGEAPGSFALEAAFDELAEKCGIDPIELRLRNEPDRGPVSGLPFAGRNLAACLREGARRFGWAERDPRPGLRREGRLLLGTGMAAASFPAGAMPSTASATAHPDGTFTVRISAADIGTGARTALTLVAADALRTSPERVHVRIGDSDFGPAMIAAAAPWAPAPGPGRSGWRPGNCASGWPSAPASRPRGSPYGRTPPRPSAPSLRPNGTPTARSSRRSPWTPAPARCGCGACSASSRRAASSTRSPRATSCGVA
ncbi:xanthine dehydrogenase family protein molybdopterin-binding subunit [Streptomyces lasalocidi]